jgi:hypothetical protein
MTFKGRKEMPIEFWWEVLRRSGRKCKYHIKIYLEKM